VRCRASATQGALKAFYDQYKEKFNLDPAVYATEGYDAATAYVKAIQAGNTTAETINILPGHGVLRRCCQGR